MASAQMELLVNGNSLPPHGHMAAQPVRRRVSFAEDDTVLEIAAAAQTAAAPAAAAAGAERGAARSIFDDSAPIPVAVNPLAFSQRGQLWRPHARSHCVTCGDGRTWYRDGHGNAGTPYRPEGALGRACACAGAGAGAGAGAEPAFVFHTDPEAAKECMLEWLDEKALEVLLAWLCGRRGAKEHRLQYQAGAGAWALRALAASCRRGRELVAAMRWIPGIHCDLFPHQVAALNRCISLEARRHSGRVCGGILCDEAGLGKTITALALIARTREPQHPRIPHGAQLRGRPGEPRFYDLESHQLNPSKLLPRDRRRTLMSSEYDPASGGLKGQRLSTRRVVNTTYDPDAVRTQVLSNTT